MQKHFFKGLGINYPVNDCKKVSHNIDLIIPILKSIVGNKKLNIWCRGSSGSICAAILASKLDNISRIVYVRKETEFKHENNYPMNNFTNIMIDDFIDSGDTLNSIKTKMERKLCTVLILVDGRNNEKYKSLIFTPKHIILNDI